MNEQPVVHVLLSSYNGEKYIREQIDSILNQKGVQVRLHIRDDGSTDSTLTILEQYQNTYGNIRVHTGENTGYIRSFIWLLQHCDAKEDEYLAFSDQDDIWEKDKLYSAVQKLKALSPGRPQLYYSDLKVVDEEGKYIRLANSWEGTIDKYKIAMFIGIRGCTEVFNYETYALLQDKPIGSISSHDTFVAMAAFWLGEVVYDPVPHIRYRQTGSNASITGTNVVNHFTKNLAYVHRRITKRKCMHENNAKEMLRYFGKDYQAETQDLKIVAEYKKNIKNRFRLLRDRRFFRFSLQIRLFNSLFILLGKL